MILIYVYCYSATVTLLLVNYSQNEYYTFSKRNKPIFIKDSLLFEWELERNVSLTRRLQELGQLVDCVFPFCETKQVLSFVNFSERKVIVF